MRKSNLFPGQPRVLLATMAMALALPALAEVSATQRLMLPESNLDVGAGVVHDSDEGRFGQYNGLDTAGVVGKADLSVVRLDAATGTWVRLTGRDLALDTRELAFEHQRQGDWKYFGEYSELPRQNVFGVVGTQIGMGNTAQVVNSPLAADFHRLNINTERDRSTVGFEKWLAPGTNVQVTLRSERKSGARMWGSNGQFMTEPISSETNQADVLLNYTGDSLQLTGGFYGTTYDNNDTRLKMSAASGAAWAGNASAGIYALPPSNESRQFSLSGGYNFSKTARISFKVSDGVATQDDEFIEGVTKLASNTRTNLGGRIESSQAFVNFTAQPFDPLTLVANFRYEDRDEQTPVTQYIASGTNNSGLNQVYSYQAKRGAVEAKYRLPDGYRLMAGFAYDEKTRPLPLWRTVQWRDKIDESTSRLELRRGLGDTLNGSLGYHVSERSGSPIQRDYTAAVVANSNTANTLNWSDRQRDKVRLRLDWLPVDPLSIQLTADQSSDDYNGTSNGIQQGSSSLLAVDATYQVTDDWKVTARASRDKTSADQRAVSGAVTIPGKTAIPSTSPWTAQLHNVSDMFGLGVEGPLTSAITLGADVQQTTDRGFARIAVQGLAGDYSLDPTTYKHLALNVFAKFDLNDRVGLRLDYLLDQWKIQDYNWSGWTYADGTVVSQDSNQDTQFMGITLTYRYW